MSGIKVDFGATDAGFTSTVQKVNGSVDGMEKNVKQAGASMKTSFASMAKAGAALALGFGAIKLAVAGVRSVIDNFGEAIDMGGRLNDLSSRTGETAGNLLLLERAFQNSGAGADKVGPAINKLQRAIVEAGQGVITYKRAFDGLGVSLDEMKKMTPTEQMTLLAERISGIQNPTERSAIAMQLLGRSGGELIPLFRNFSNEMGNAKAELGSLPGIMDKGNGAFDAIADRIAVVKGKFTEFAAGVLSQVLPAIELIVTALSRIDAAAIGMKLADIFVGGQKAMDGFGAALAAFKMGEFSLSFSISWDSIKLQAAQTANSIYANMKAAISATVAFITTAFGPGSGIFTAIDAQIDRLSLKIKLAIEEANPFGTREIVTDGLKLAIKSSERLIETALGEIGNDFTEAGEKASQAYDNALQSSGKLIETTEMEISLQKRKSELIIKQAAEAARAAAEALKAGENQIEVDTSSGATRESSAQRIKELESDIKDAKAMGNKELAAELESQKAYFEQLERSLGNNKTLGEAMADALQAQNAHLGGVIDKQQKVTKQLKEQLSLSAQIAAKIKEAEAKDKIDKGGRLEKRANDAIAEGDFRGAARAMKRIAGNEQNDAIQEAFGGDSKTKKSLSDIAKEQGIDTFRKSSRDLRKELAELAKKRKEELKPGAGGKNKEEAGNNKAPAKDPMLTLSDLVKDIKILVAKIEPKLPVAALGI
jgi:hypothetical protein